MATEREGKREEGKEKRRVMMNGTFDEYIESERKI